MADGYVMVVEDLVDGVFGEEIGVRKVICMVVLFGVVLIAGMILMVDAHLCVSAFICGVGMAFGWRVVEFAL